MRVLLIEDEADIADALARFLRAQGHAVDHAPDLDTGRAALEVAGFDAILLDLALPDGSGLVLLREQRRSGNRVPVIIATARDQITERIAGLDAGADDYVVKPYDLAEIEARLRANARRATGDPATESRLGAVRRASVGAGPGAVQAGAGGPALCLRRRDRGERGRGLCLAAARQAGGRGDPDAAGPGIPDPVTRPWSLRGRLIRRVVLGACLAWLAGVGLAMLVVSHEMTELMDDSLEGSARLSLALYRGAGQVGGPVQGPDAIRIIDGGVTVTDAPWPPGAALGGQDMGGWRVFRLVDPDGGIAIEVGHTTAWRRDELRESLGWLVALMLPVLLAAPLAIRGAVGSALRPATRFADALRARSAQDLSPVAAPDLPVELTPIPQALNGYLDTIRARIDAERQFATNAAHELRTPIAAASGQAQLIAAGLADGAAAGRLAGALGRMGHLVDRLLQLSRAEAGSMGAGPCDLIRVARMVIDDLGLPLRFDDGEMTSAPVAVDPDALALILRNLLRNAADHGAGDIRVLIAAGPELTVANAVGAGATFRPATFDKSATSQGAGLGLAIVARVAGAQGITVDYAMEWSRATVTLRLPAAEDRSTVEAE